MRHYICLICKNKYFVKDDDPYDICSKCLYKYDTEKLSYLERKKLSCFDYIFMCYWLK